MTPIKTLRRAVAAVTLVAATASAAAAADPAPRKITMGLLFIAADAGIFVAKDKGYFAAQGLDVDFQRFTSGADQIPLLATNKMEIGSGGSTPALFNAYARGIDVPIVASKAIISAKNFDALMVRTDLYDSGITSAAKLKGLRIVVNNIQSPSLDYVVRGLATGGLTKDDVTMLEMPFEQFIPALQKKAVDVALSFSPLTETITQKLKIAVRLPETGTGTTSTNDTANMMFFSPDFLKSDDAPHFMAAFLTGQREYQRALFGSGEGRDEVCGIVHKYIAFVPPDCSGMSMTEIEPDGAVNVPSLEAYQSDWVKWGMMHAAVDIRAHVDMRPVEAALQQIGKYQK